MRTKTKKLYWLWDFEEEEQWLNQMSAKGLQLVAVGLCNYTFEEDGQVQYTIRTELLEHFPDHPESKKYLEFIEETGAEYLGAVKATAYFRKEKSKGDFQLHSDSKARLSLIRRVQILCMIGLIVEIFATIPNAMVFIKDTSMVTNGLISLLNVLIGGLFVYGLVKLTKKKKKLNKIYALYESN